MSAGKVVGLLSGLFALVDNGLEGCKNGFGTYGCDETPSGAVSLTPTDTGNDGGSFGALNPCYKRTVE